MGKSDKSGKRAKTATKGRGKGSGSVPVRPVIEALKVPQGPVDLTDYDPRATPCFNGDKVAGKAALGAMEPALAELQERLFAEGRTEGNRSLLLVLQGMDTSGKGGVARHAVGLFDPQAVRVKAFAAPTPAELRHSFLWRIRAALPEPGMIGIFDRSHYEDVIAARVRSLATEDQIEKRYGAINRFERQLVESGTTIVKCLLHISPEEQNERLLARLDDPTKNWKFDPGDIDDRALWPDYRRAYEIAIERTNTEVAPWLVVPADRKWYKNWAAAAILLELLRGLDPQWPKADFDIDEQRRRLLAQESPSR